MNDSGKYVKIASLILITVCILFSLTIFTDVGAYDSNKCDLIIRDRRYIENLTAQCVVVDGGFLEVVGGHVNILHIRNGGTVEGWIPVDELYAKDFSSIWGIEVYKHAEILDGKYARIIITQQIFENENGQQVRIQNVDEINVECHLDECPWGIYLKNNTNIKKSKILEMLRKYALIEDVDRIKFTILSPSIRIENVVAPFLSFILFEEDAESAIKDSSLDEIFSSNKLIIIENSKLNSLNVRMFKAKNVTVNSWLAIVENHDCMINDTTLTLPRNICFEKTSCYIIQNGHEEYDIELRNSTIVFISKNPVKIHVRGYGKITTSGDAEVEEGNITVISKVYNVTVEAPENMEYMITCGGISRHYRGNAFIKECSNPVISFYWMKDKITCSFCTYDLKEKVRIFLLDFKTFAIMVMIFFSTLTSALIFRKIKNI